MLFRSTSFMTSRLSAMGDEMPKPRLPAILIMLLSLEGWNFCWVNPNPLDVPWPMPCAREKAAMPIIPVLVEFPNAGASWEDNPDPKLCATELIPVELTLYAEATWLAMALADSMSVMFKPVSTPILQWLELLTSFREIRTQCQYQEREQA